MEKEKLSRNDYFKKVQELGAKRTQSGCEIAPLDLSKYKVNEKTIKVLNANFMEESKDRNGNYMLKGHWLCDLCFQFAERCKFDLVLVDLYSAYAYSDEQMAIFTYCEGDITLTLFTETHAYEVEKAETKKFYEEI